MLTLVHDWREVTAIGKPIQDDPTGRLLVVGLCWLQTLLALVATFVVWGNVESILGFGPALCLAGILTSSVAIYRASLQLLLFGLAAMATTGLIAYVISAFALSPGEAATPVTAIFAVYTLAAVYWLLVATVRFRDSSMFRGFEPAETGFKFSMRTLLITTTCVCAIAAIMRQLDFRGEMIFFVLFGSAVFAICFVLAFTFRMRTRKAVVASDPQLKAPSKD